MVSLAASLQRGPLSPRGRGVGTAGWSQGPVQRATGVCPKGGKSSTALPRPLEAQGGWGTQEGSWLRRGSWVSKDVRKVSAIRPQLHLKPAAGSTQWSCTVGSGRRGSGPPTSVWVRDSQRWGSLISTQPAHQDNPASHLPHGQLRGGWRLPLPALGCMGDTCVPVIWQPGIPRRTLGQERR